MEKTTVEIKLFRLDFFCYLLQTACLSGMRTLYMNQDNDNIQQVLSKARSGNRVGMERLAVIVRERLYPFVFRTTLNQDLTEDILQETLLTMVGQVAHLRVKSRFWPWVFRIAYSKLQDNLRIRLAQNSGKDSLRRNQLCESHAGSGGILEETIHAERLQRLSALMGRLSRQSRDILHLRYYEQLPYTEIATLTRTTPQKARARFYRARKYLKAQLKDDTRYGISTVV
jgi:RNA polymerase sigma factor (sigma-70 family)